MILILLTLCEPLTFTKNIIYMYDVVCIRRLPVSRDSNDSDDSTDSEEELDSPKRIQQQQPAAGEKMDIDSNEGMLAAVVPVTRALSWCFCPYLVLAGSDLKKTI